MRVITGKARGRRLFEPKDMSVRPTTDMVKEAVFNIIQFDVEGRRVLDLFAGTGQLGIEALSRGAASAVFVDSSRQSIELVRKNLAACDLTGRVLQTDALAFLERGGAFDIVFIDPPYAAGLWEAALERIFRFDILSDGGIIICESGRETAMPEAPKPYFKGREYRYGKIKLTVYGKGEYAI